MKKLVLALLVAFAPAVALAEDMVLPSIFLPTWMLANGAAPGALDLQWQEAERKAEESRSWARKVEEQERQKRELDNLRRKRRF